MRREFLGDGCSMIRGYWARLNKENVPSRAYIAFRDEETLAVFSREYDGHVFRDKAGACMPLLLAQHATNDALTAGNESIAVVEFAPFQKVPNEKKKADSRAGTIEKGVCCLISFKGTSSDIHSRR